MAWKNEDRWYTSPSGKKLPSVTTILSVLDKSGPLMAWAVKEERKYIKFALKKILEEQKQLEVASLDKIWELIEGLTKGIKQADKISQKALNIGTEAHTLAELETRRMLGEKVEKIKTSREARRAFNAWKKWTKEVNFKPISIEQKVYNDELNYAGTLDVYAKINGKLTICDYKTSKAIYPEYFLQLIAYQYAAAQLNMPSVQALVLRLPKTKDDPNFEAKIVPNTITINDFLKVRDAWFTKKKIEKINREINKTKLEDGEIKE